MAEEETLKSRYTQLEDKRSSSLDMAEEAAKMSIPSAFMEEGSSSQDSLQRNYSQNFVAGLVDGLVGKLAGSIMPASQPFFRLMATIEAMEAVAQGDSEAEFQIEKILAGKERDMLRYINKSRFRESLYPALRQMVITGNCLVEKLDDEDKYRVIKLRDYVVSRDYSGKVVELIIRETLDKETMPEDLQGSIDDNAKQEDIHVYTGVKLIEGKYELTQEVNEEKTGEESTIANLEERYMDLRWNKIDGEDYGRGFIEDSIGTLYALEKQMKMLAESSIVQAKTVHTINPNGFTKLEDFVNAKNGSVIIGQEADVGTIKVNKANDLQMSYELIKMWKQELEEKFMKFVARDSERTTAFEVQKAGAEIEAAFGGIYTHIASDIQMPLLVEAMKHLKIDGKDDVDVIIMSGVQALGRNAESIKVQQMMQETQVLGQIVGPEVVAGALNAQSLLTTIVSNSGVANKDFIKSTDQQATEQGAAKQEQMSQQMLQQGVQSAGKMAEQGNI